MSERSHDILESLRTNPLDPNIVRAALQNGYDHDQLRGYLVSGLISASCTDFMYVTNIEQGPTEQQLEMEKSSEPFRQDCARALRALRRAGLDLSEYLRYIESLSQSYDPSLR